MHYDRCVTLQGHPLVVARTAESITITCNKEIVARWSTGEDYRDLVQFRDWLEITGAKVEGAEDVISEIDLDQ